MLTVPFVALAKKRGGAPHVSHAHHLIRDVDSTTPGNTAFGLNLGAAAQDNESIGMGCAIQLPISHKRRFASYISEGVQLNTHSECSGSLEYGRWSAKSPWMYGVGFDAIANPCEQTMHYWVSMKSYYNLYVKPKTTIFIDFSPKMELHTVTHESFLMEYGIAGATQLSGIHWYIGYSVGAQSTLQDPLVLECSLSISYVK